MQLSLYVLLNHHIYIAADATPVDVDHAAHACHCIVRPQFLLIGHNNPTILNVAVNNYDCDGLIV